MKKKGFSLVEVAIAGVIFTTSILMVQRLLAPFFISYVHQYEQILQQTQNFHSNQEFLSVDEIKTKNILWEKSSLCNTNDTKITCQEYQIIFPNKKKFSWNKYEITP